MKIIQKYRLSIEHEQMVEMPVDGKIVKLDYDPSNHLCLWVELDSNSFEMSRYFKLYGTGDEIDETDEYIGTMIKGQIVWHVYEKII